MSLLALIKMGKIIRTSLLEALAKQKHELEPASLGCLATPLKESTPITLDQEDMLLGDYKYNRSFYYTGYIQKAKVYRIQIDPSSTVNILPVQIMTGSV
ncbi:hypothetical protein AAC387_Pa11g0935 [Persea americana]